MDRARLVRRRAFVDTTLRSYRADARGYVYFFLDRPGSEERTPVKTDQIALEVFWQAPDQTHQRIVGRRDEKLLPTNISYHLDHLTVVQDEFPDRIRLGDGDEVADVTHPAAPGAESVYDFRLADSLTIALPGEAEPVRVYEVQVKPKRMDLPGFVGAIFLDRATGAIVRMRFTFTPSSYVDPYLDYIRISLDNMLWEGGHWLPYRQVAELRRELPQLDFAAGSIIRGRFEIGPYDFNVAIPPGLLRRGRVSTVHTSALEAFEFEEELFAGLEEEGLDTPASIEEIRRRAREMAEDRYLSGLRRFRLHLPSASRVYRYDRAEGHVVGAGWSYALSGEWAVAADVGWAFGRERANGGLRLTRRGDVETTFSAWANEPVDIGPVPGASTVVNTLGALLYDADYTDPYFTSGVAARTEFRPDAGGPIGFLGLRSLAWSVERHRSARVVLDDAGLHRPVRPVEEGDASVLRSRSAWGSRGTGTDGWGATLDVEAATDTPLLDDPVEYARVIGSLAWGRSGNWRNTTVELRLDAGLSDGGAPQALFLLGGRGTLLGHGYRRYVGDLFWLVRAETSRTVAEPWLTLRTGAAAGQAHLDGALPGGWTGDPDGGVLGSVSAGVGLLWDVLHLDVGRGLGPGGDWQVAFSVAGRFHDWL